MPKYELYAAIRDAKGLRDAQVARMAHIPETTLYDWKAGRYVPKYDKIRRIAIALNVSVEEFVEDE